MISGKPGILVDFVFSARRWTPDRIVWSKSKWALLLCYSLVLAGAGLMFWICWIQGASQMALWVIGGIASIILHSIIYTLREDRHLVFHREPAAIELAGSSWGKDQGRRFGLAGELRVLRASTDGGRGSNVVLELQTDDDFSLRCFLGFHAFGAMGKDQVKQLVSLGDRLESMAEGRLRFVRRDPYTPGDD